MTYVPIYLDDLFGSPAVDLMDATLFGAYMAVFLRMYQMGGTIPGDDATLRRYSKLSAQQWRSYRVALRELFDCLPNGCLTHNRVASELARLAEKLEKRHAKAVLGAEARWSKHATSNASGMPQASAKHDASNANQNQNQNHTSTTVDDTPPPPRGGKVGKLDQQFEACWEVYGRKGSKAAARPLWDKLPQADRDAAQADIPARVAATIAGDAARRQYLKDFERYLRNRQWEAALPVTQTPNQTNGHPQFARPSVQRGSIVPDADALGQALARSHAARLRSHADDHNPGSTQG